MGALYRMNIKGKASSLRIFSNVLGIYSNTWMVLMNITVVI